MSERKVLNKYYPPDYDPSKIPRSKEPRNKTFTIRLMAPCNMRCTTCGEYIYKGRKFNARKEDVDDMNHLGLRIYRFYIKCTACLSEISFRTDPANTDYILEAGATRNFEALAKAEKQAELEENARLEELATNPMKLLEERTEASKNEMARMEALEELQELNKREVKVDYEGLLSRYDRVREAEASSQEQEDEEFVQSIFSKDGGGVTVKRIADKDEGSSSEEEEEGVRRSKVARVERATDLLSERKETGKKVEAWEKSIGTIASSSSSLKKIGGLGVLVKKKGEPTSLVEKKKIATETSSIAVVPPQSEQKSALSLVGDYSDSE